MSETELYYMNEAVSIARSCIEDNKRFPFGSIVVQNNTIVGIGMESTRVNNDPTAHSEIEAIRNACKNLKTDSLKDCVLYTSSEPCSMCLSALFWSQISTVYYACSRDEVYNFGFSDRFKLVEKRKQILNSDYNNIKLIQINNSEALQVFKEWEYKERVVNSFLK